jgi:hypothetical protein
MLVSFIEWSQLLHWFVLRPKNIKKCGEVSSPQVVKDVVIYGSGCCEENKKTRQMVQ